MSDNLAFLVKRFKEGEQSAFKQLYTLYLHKVRGFATLYLRNREDIQDVVQDIFIKLWENREKIENSENFDGYLFILSRNYIFNLKRSMINTHVVDLTLLNVVDSLQDVEAEIAVQDIRAHITKIVDSQPAQRKKIFLLSRQEHKTYREIAEILNTSEKSVEYNISMVLAEIKSQLKSSVTFSFLIWSLFVN